MISVTSGVNIPASVSITDCLITINGNTGISMDLIDPMPPTNITVERNRIDFNSTNGIVLTRQVFPQIHCNHFDNNGLSNLRLQIPYPVILFDTLNADSNYWGGANDQASVDATIRDRLDDASIGTRVKSFPWLDQSPVP